MVDGLLRKIDDKELRKSGIKVRNNGARYHALVFSSKKFLEAFLTDFARFGVDQHLARAEERADLVKLDLAYKRRDHFSLDYELSKRGYCQSFKIFDNFQDKDNKKRSVVVYPIRAEPQLQLYLKTKA